jgi:hypothetical protein
LAGGAGSASALARGRWRVLARSPLRARYGALAAWDGRELIEAGGWANARESGPIGRGVAAFDPATGRWWRLASAPAQVAPGNAAAVWTGQKLFVFTGALEQEAVVCCAAGLLDPASDRWTLTPPEPFGRVSSPHVVWTGKTVVLAGIAGGFWPRSRLVVAAYDPATNAWTKLHPPLPAGHAPLGLAMVATSDGILLWSMWSRPGNGSPSGVDVLRLSSGGAWSTVTGAWPQHHTVDQPTFTGTEILFAPGQLWCGLCSHPAPFGEHGYFADPRTLRRTAIPAGPFDDLGPQIVWTGAAEISFNAGGEISGPGVNVLPGELAIYDATTHRWKRGPRAPRHPGDAPAAWTGTELLVLARNGHLLSFGR